MPHMFVVWTLVDIFGAIFWGIAGLILAVLGVMFLAETVWHRILKMFGRR